MSQIAIVYGSRYGSTRGIAAHMAEKIKEKGKEVLLIDAEDKEKVKEAFSGEIKALILGSSIAISQWTKPMKKIIKLYKDKILNSDLLAMFVSCGTASDEKGIEKACNEYVFQFAKDHDLEPKLLAAFGGVYDFSENSKFGMAKGILKKMLEKESPGKYDLNGVNDMRNWKKIDEFIEKILENT
ncbi:MAG: flavodoxin domain-containing protein [Candidatus Hodarchaeota archaeon]